MKNSIGFNDKGFKTLSIAALAGCAILGAPAIADDTTAVKYTLNDGTEKTVSLQTTYGTGDSSVTKDIVVLGQQVTYTQKYDSAISNYINKSVSKSATDGDDLKPCPVSVWTGFNF